jgi:acyl-CoA thioesterase I
MNSKTKLFALGVAIIIISLAITPSILQTVGYKNNQSNRIPVACVGDSITAGTEYTIDLWRLLGRNYLVGNFGDPGATVSSSSDSSYVNQSAFEVALQFEPKIVIIMLGTNDAHTTLNVTNADFVNSYVKLVNEFQNLASKPKIWIVMPPPIFNNDANLSAQFIPQNLIPNIEQVANTVNVSVIDVYSPLVNHGNYFPDGVHPDSNGSKAIATIICNALNLKNNST